MNSPEISQHESQYNSFMSEVHDGSMCYWFHPKVNEYQICLLHLGHAHVSQCQWKRQYLNTQLSQGSVVTHLRFNVGNLAKVL